MAGHAPNRTLVTIPTRNRLPFLRRSLPSALAQDAGDVAVLVVDDGSTDGTAEWLAGLRDPRVTVLRHEQSRGVAAARNRALEFAGEARWLAFLDDDDIMGPRHLPALLDAAERADAGLAYSGAVWVDDDFGIVDLRPPRPRRNPRRDMLRENIVGPPSGALVSAEVFQETGGFDEQLSLLADWDMWLQVSQLTSIACVPALTYAYTFHDDNMSRDMERVASDAQRLVARRDRLAREMGVARRGQTAHSFVAWIDRLHGRRLRSAYGFARSFAQRGDPKELGRAAAALVLGQGGMQRMRRLLFRRRENELQWLDRYR